MDYDTRYAPHDARGDERMTLLPLMEMKRDMKQGSHHPEVLDAWW
jgi:hypothetical protein